MPGLVLRERGRRDHPDRPPRDHPRSRRAAAAGLGPGRRRAVPPRLDAAPRLLLDERRHDARLPVPLQLVREADLRPALHRAIARTRVVDEIAWLKDTYRPDHLWIADDIFGLKPGWIERFADRSSSGARVRAVQVPAARRRRHPTPIVAALQRAGCRTVWIGAESGSQRILDAMEKGTRVEQIAAAARPLHAAGIEVGFFLQFGYPGETLDDIELTLRDGARLPARRHRRVGVVPAAGHAVLRAREGPARREAELGRLERPRHDVSRHLRPGVLPRAARARARAVPGAETRRGATRCARPPPRSTTAVRAPWLQLTVRRLARDTSAPPVIIRPVLTPAGGRHSDGSTMNSGLATATLVRIGELTNRTFVLPVLVFFPTSRCNSRCVSCDWWKSSGADDLTLAEIAELAESLPALGTRLVVFSGGEPLLRPDVFEAARAVPRQRAHAAPADERRAARAVRRRSGRGVLARHRLARRVDRSALPRHQGRERPWRWSRRASRGCGGSRPSIPVTARATLHRMNFRELPRLIDHARAMALDGISFLAADVSSSAFGRGGAPAGARSCRSIAGRSRSSRRSSSARSSTGPSDFESGFIAESPAKLRRLPQYYDALGQRPPLPPRRLQRAVDVGGRRGERRRPSVLLPRADWQHSRGAAAHRLSPTSFPGSARCSTSGPIRSAAGVCAR